MSEMEEKLNAVLSNPQMMQQIMSMAQAMGVSQPSSPAPAQPEPDLAMLQKLSSAAAQANTDRDQQALLKALGPYLSRDRIGRLEKAMRAAKMAKLASTLLGAGGR